MQRTKPKVAVLTADIIRSTQYDYRTRLEIDRVLRVCFKEVARKYPKAVHTKLAFRVTAGDEFQGVFVAVPNSFEVLTYLRALAATSEIIPMLTFRASIGVGEITVSGRKTSYEEDGPAFVRSRSGLEELSGRTQRWTKIVTGDPDVDRTLDIVMLLLDRQQKSWTVPQWEAVKWTLRGLTRERTASKLDVKHQNITKRLTAAGWKQFQKAAEFVREPLERSAAP